MRLYFVDQARDFAARVVGNAVGDFLFGKVDVRLHPRQQMFQTIVPVLVFFRQRAPHLAQSLFALLFRFGVHQIRQPFRRCQIHFAVFDGAAGEFSASGGTESFDFRQVFQHRRRDRPSAVGLKFNDVLARKAVRAGKIKHQSVVDRRAVQSADFGKYRLPRARIFNPRHQPDGVKRVRARHAHDRHPRLARSRRRRKNRSVHFRRPLNDRVLSYHERWRFKRT